MTRVGRHALVAAGFAAALALAGGAQALKSHADATAVNQATACKLALALARQDVAANRVRASRCECLEDKDDPETPWSCTAFVSYR